MAEPKIDEAVKIAFSGQTKELILTAAEHLFAEHGLAGVSMREITRVAGVNIAAINYHFRTKEKLFEEVFLRRTKPIAAERLRLLRKAEEQADGRPELEDILRAFITPSFGRTPEERDTLLRVARLRARLATEPAEFAQDLLGRVFDESSRAFLQALEKALPELTPQDVHWRFHFMLGTTVYTWGTQRRVESIGGGKIDTSDAASVIAHLIPFLTAGFRAGSLG
ncbi:TetR/AcrR family transcriptional regulator [Pseudochelatococcus sp. B33]